MKLKWMRPGMVLTGWEQRSRHLHQGARWPRFPLAKAVLGIAVLMLYFYFSGIAPSFGASPPHSKSAASAPKMARAEVTVGRTVFTVDIADTPALQARGLGGRRSLSPTEGMVFLYADRATHSFWMLGMTIPIDIIWLDNNKVVHIEHRVPPPKPGTPSSQLLTYRPPTKANIVLEIAAGRARALGLKQGDTLRFRFNIR